MDFKIEEPDNELTVGYLTLVIKYIVLIVVSWIAGWMLLLFPPIKSNHSSPNQFEDKTHNAYLISILIAVHVLAFYSYKIYRKGKYGLLKEISFSDDNIRLTIINEITGKLKNIILQPGAFKVEKEIKNHFLYGKQRVYTLREKYEDLTYLNIDLSAWNSHPDVQQLMTELEKFV